MFRSIYAKVMGKRQSEEKAWWQDERCWHELSEQIENAGISFNGWFGVSGLGWDPSYPTAQLKGRDDLIQWATTLPLGSHSIRKVPEVVTGTELLLEIGWPDEESSLQLVLCEPELNSALPRLPSALREMITHTASWFNSYEIPVRGMSVMMSGLGQACLRPPRDFTAFSGHPNCAFLVQAYDRCSPEWSTEESRCIERVASAELLEGVQRWDDGRILLLQWVSSLADLDEARRQLIRRELWLQQLGLPWERDSSYNEYGDYLEGPMIFSEPLEPFTFYSPGRKWGYKAVVPTEDGGLDEEAVAALRPLLRAGRVSADRELHGMTFIAPDRDAAVRLLPAAKAFGARSVWYPHTRKGCYWDIDPPGNWLPPDAVLLEADSLP